MSRSIVTALALGLLIGAACKKKSETPANPEPAAAPQAAKPETKQPPPPAAPTGVGVEPGGIKRDAQIGAAAVVTNANGTVEVRRLGETTYAAAKATTQLYPGDIVRTGEASTAAITLADESVIEVAEVSTIGIGSRDGTADPASAAAVLGGIARFTVTPRAPAEGAFRAYTPSGVIITRGTTYGVGVAASGEARVGVESGAVDVYGLAKLASAPVVVAKSTNVVIAANGEVGAPAPWPTDDWGSWRDTTDAKVELVAAVDAHGTAMTDLNQALADGYLELATNADQAATFEATAATSAASHDVAGYQAIQVDGAATIDASFSLAGRLEALTWAYASHASLATDLYVRHPTEIEARWQLIAPRVDAAVLWPKRYEVTAIAYFQPLRAQYYVHHPRGRAHAALVGITVPQFYAQIEPAPIDAPTVRAKLKGSVWIAPDLTYRASPRPVWVAAPSASWHAKVKVAAAPPRAKVAWYVRPPALKANVLVGGKVTGTWASKLAVRPAEPYASLRASWKVPIGMKVKIAAPDLSAAANARAKVKLGADGRIVHDHRATGVATGDVKAGVKGKLDVKAPVVAVPDVKAGVGVGVGVGVGAGAAVRDHRTGAAKAVGGAGAKIGGGVKAGAAVDVKVKPPEVKVKGEAKGGIKIGN